MRCRTLRTSAGWTCFTVVGSDMGLESCPIMCQGFFFLSARYNCQRVSEYPHVPITLDVHQRAGGDEVAGKRAAAVLSLPPGNSRPLLVVLP
jgi:hypothetical protein